MRKRLVVLIGGAIAAGLLLAIAKGYWRPQPRRTFDKFLQRVAQTKAPADPASDSPPGAGMSAVEKAASSKRYLFAFFWKEENDQTRTSRAVFEAAVKKVADRAQSVAVRIDDPAERRIVDKFQLDRAPMPLVLVLAPNGAITGGFPSRVEEAALLGAFATPCSERSMKALQENKLVLVCVQNEATRSNQAAMRGVGDFQADPRYHEVTEIVMLNPAEAGEASFLRDLKISPKTEQAVTAFMAPPGMVIAEFTGATTNGRIDGRAGEGQLRLLSGRQVRSGRMQPETLTSHAGQSARMRLRL
jgi:hypothetical protein